MDLQSGELPLSFKFDRAHAEGSQEEGNDSIRFPTALNMKCTSGLWHFTPCIVHGESNNQPSTKGWAWKRLIVDHRSGHWGRRQIKDSLEGRARSYGAHANQTPFNLLSWSTSCEPCATLGIMSVFWEPALSALLWETHSFALHA